MACAALPHPCLPASPLPPPLQPYYPAFDTDLAAKCCVHPLPCYLSEQAADEGLPIRAQLDAAAADAASFGVPVKVRVRLHCLAAWRPAWLPACGVLAGCRRAGPPPASVQAARTAL